MANISVELQQVSNKALAAAKARMLMDQTNGPEIGTAWEAIPSAVRESMIKDSCASMIMAAIRSLSTAEANKNAKAVNKALAVYDAIYAL